MKNILFAALMTLTTSVFSQTKSEFGDFAHVTSKKDTLFLLKSDTMSKITFNIWKNDPKWNGTNPTILFVNQKEMLLFKQNQSLAVRREENLNSNN